MTNEQVDTHDPAGMAAFLRERAKANREIAGLPIDQWPHRPDVLRHWALRFEQAAQMIDDLAHDLSKSMANHVADINAHEPETERCESLSPDHGTWRCEKPTGHQGPHEVHGDTAYVSWAPDKSFVQKAKAYGPGMTPHADDCECYVCGPKRFCPHCGKSEPHTHRVPGVAEPVVFPHS